MLPADIYACRIRYCIENRLIVFSDTGLCSGCNTNRMAGETDFQQQVWSTCDSALCLCLHISAVCEPALTTLSIMHIIIMQAASRITGQRLMPAAAAALLCHAEVS